MLGCLVRQPLENKLPRCRETTERLALSCNSLIICTVMQQPQIPHDLGHFGCICHPVLPQPQRRESEKGQRQHQQQGCIFARHMPPGGEEGRRKRPACCRIRRISRVLADIYLVCGSLGRRRYVFTPTPSGFWSRGRHFDNTDAIPLEAFPCIAIGSSPVCVAFLSPWQLQRVGLTES